MSDPVSGGLIVASTALSTMGKLYAGKQQEEMYKTQATLSVEQAQMEEERIRRENRRILSEQRLRYGASGVTFEGSPMAVMSESKLQAELEAKRVRWAGQTEATLNRWYAHQARKASYWGAASSILGGATQAYGSWGKTKTYTTG